MPLRKLLLSDSSSFFSLRQPWRWRPRLDVWILLHAFLIHKSCQHGGGVVHAFQVSAVSPHTEFFPQTTQPPVLTKTTNDNGNNGGSSLPLKPVSTDPLLLVSTQPVLSPFECHTLSDYFQKQQLGGQGAEVLHSLQDRLDTLICRPPQDCHDRVQPRFLSYQPCNKKQKQKPTDALALQKWLLPDGLHVDTNNGKFFRYLTVLVYLTSSSSAATNFPLGLRRKNNSGTRDEGKLLEASMTLLQANVKHTRADYNDCRDDESSQGNKDPRTLLEQAAWETYINDSNAGNAQQDIGIRVLPRQGHITVFASIDPASGMADPRSWHGPEVLLPGDSKELLSFFYEVPVEEFVDQTTLGQAVGRRLNLLHDKYVKHVPAGVDAESKPNPLDDNDTIVSMPDMQLLVVQ